MLKATYTIFTQDARGVTYTNNVGQRLGSVAQTNDGRVYAFALNGAVALAAGKTVMSTSTTANHVNRTGTANAIGTQTISFTLGATAATQDQYASGYLAVTEVGQNVYKIKGNSVVASGGGTVNVYLNEEEPLTVATTTSSKFSLYPHPYSSVVLSDHTQSSGTGIQVVGVPNIAVPASAYAWVQIGGYCATLSDGIIAKNAACIVSPSVDGAVVTEGTSGIVKRLGYAPEATVDTKYYPVVLDIDGINQA